MRVITATDYFMAAARVCSLPPHLVQDHHRGDWSDVASKFWVRIEMLDFFTYSSEDRLHPKRVNSETIEKTATEQERDHATPHISLPGTLYVTMEPIGTTVYDLV